jgi:predicted phosphodiesterase
LRYAIFSDIHSNLEALQSVIADMQSVEVQRYICLGDIVGYNADPRACLDLVQTLDCPVIKGNHDEAAAHNEDLPHFNPLAMKGIEHSRRELTPDRVAYLECLPLTLGFTGFAVVHATMHQPEHWQYVHTEREVWNCIQYQPGRLCFIGHTHTPMIYFGENGIKVLPHTANTPVPIQFDGKRKYLVNVGSVGQPRDGDWRACYVIYDDEACTLEFRRLNYNLPVTQKKIIQAGLPEILAQRLSVGR